MEENSLYVSCHDIEASSIIICRIIAHIIFSSTQSMNAPLPIQSYQPTMNSKTQSKKAPPVKRVRFAETSTLIITVRTSPREPKELWLTKREIKRSRQNTNEAAKATRKTTAARAFIIQSMAADGQDVKQINEDKDHIDQLCGIEHLVSYEVCRALLTSKFLALRRVLDEQARQRRTGAHDSGKIAEASIKASLFSRLWHQRIAAINSIN